MVGSGEPQEPDSRFRLLRRNDFDHGGHAEVPSFLMGRTFRVRESRAACKGVVPMRFSYLDLNDKAIQGGRVYDWTIDLDLFLNPNTKVQLNYVLEHRQAPQDVVQGWISGVGVRGSYDF